uniref:Uncharacterized protein n=1 Tax=Anguilla anguilla TaxID=7936 RepID=A0A0E9RZL4_ANGAN
MFCSYFGIPYVQLNKVISYFWETLVLASLCLRGLESNRNKNQGGI